MDPYQKIGEPDDGYALELLKHEKMFVSGYDPIGIGHEGTFQNSIVRFIFEVVNVRLGLEDRCGFADGAEEPLDLVVCPHKLAAKGVRLISDNYNSRPTRRTPVGSSLVFVFAPLVLR